MMGHLFIVFKWCINIVDEFLVYQFKEEFVKLNGKAIFTEEFSTFKTHQSPSTFFWRKFPFKGIPFVLHLFW